MEEKEEEERGYDMTLGILRRLLEASVPGTGGQRGGQLSVLAPCKRGEGWRKEMEGIAGILSQAVQEGRGSSRGKKDRSGQLAVPCKGRKWKTMKKGRKPGAQGTFLQALQEGRSRQDRGADKG